MLNNFAWVSKQKPTPFIFNDRISVQTAAADATFSSGVINMSLLNCRYYAITNVWANAYLFSSPGALLMYQNAMVRVNLFWTYATNMLTPSKIFNGNTAFGQQTFVTSFFWGPNIGLQRQEYNCAVVRPPAAPPTILFEGALLNPASAYTAYLIYGFEGYYWMS